VQSKGAPGLAFETWDPSNQFPLETPTLLFVIRSEEFGNLAAIGMSLGDQLRELDEEFLKFAGRFERGQSLGQCGAYRGYGRLRLGGP
jgi:hypothetical protein